jgi:hypothetical protein
MPLGRLVKMNVSGHGECGGEKKMKMALNAAVRLIRRDGTRVAPI